MNKVLLGALLLLSPLLLLAHNPLSARYYLESDKQGTFLNIYLSQDGVHQALTQKYGRQVLTQYGSPAFKQVIVHYIKENFSLKADGEPLELLEGGIKLGNHQTDLKFLVTPLSKAVQQLEVHIPAFQENQHHQTIFSYNIYDKVDKVILSEHNNYQSTILLRDNFSIIWAGVAGAFLLVVAVVFLKRKSF